MYHFVFYGTLNLSIINFCLNLDCAYVFNQQQFSLKDSYPSGILSQGIEVFLFTPCEKTCKNEKFWSVFKYIAAWVSALYYFY